MSAPSENHYRFYLPVWLWLTLLFLLLGVFSLWCLCNKELSLILFLISGVTHAIFYGRKNDQIFHFPHAEENREFDMNKIDFLKIKEIENKKGGIKATFGIMPFTKAPYRNKYAKVNTLWVHLICSVAGAIALYLLLNRFNLLNLNSWTLKHLGFSDFVLFLVALLGYTGLLPMTLWFFANSGKLLENLIKPK